MSHVAVRIVANAFEDAVIGVNTIAATVPRLGTDEAPPSVTVYDETQDAWVMRGLAPDDADTFAGINFPAVVVTLQGVVYDAGRGDSIPGGVMAKGVATVIVQLILRAADTIDGVTDSMYLARGIRGSLQLLDCSTDTVRESCGVRLFESTGVSQVKMKAERGDLIVASAFLVTYPVWETTPATF